MTLQKLLFWRFSFYVKVCVSGHLYVKNENSILLLRNFDLNQVQLMHPERMRYHCTTESTENIDCSQAI